MGTGDFDRSSDSESLEGALGTAERRARTGGLWILGPPSSLPFGTFSEGESSWHRFVVRIGDTEMSGGHILIEGPRSPQDERPETFAKRGRGLTHLTPHPLDGAFEHLHTCD